MLKLEIYDRYAEEISMYFDVCREECQKCEEYGAEYMTFIETWKTWDKDFPAVRKTDLLKDSSSLMDKQYRHWAGAVLFGAMCLESFIYDYAARGFSDTYVKRYLDRLDLKAKWVVIPKLVTGKDFPTDSKAFQNLQRLVVERNKLAHHKSKPPMSEEEFEKMLRKTEEMVNKQNQTIGRKEFGVSFFGISPYETVIDVLTELRGLEDEVNAQWWALKKINQQE
jgi:hypothetical protein